MTRPLLRVEKGPAPEGQRTASTSRKSKREQRGVRRGSQSQSQSQQPEPETRVAQPRPAWPSPASLSSSKQNPALEGVGVAPLELWPSGDWSSPRALLTTHSHRSRARESSALAKTCMRTSSTPAGCVGCSSFLFRKRGSLCSTSSDAEAYLQKTGGRCRHLEPGLRHARRALAPSSRLLQGTSVYAVLYMQYCRH